MEKNDQKGLDSIPLCGYNRSNVAEETRRPSFQDGTEEPSVTPISARSIYDKRIWVIEDVVEFTGFAKSTIYKMTSRREIPHRKRGKKLFFIPSEIWNWIEEA